MRDLVDAITRNWLSVVPIVLFLAGGLATFVRKTVAQRRFSLADYSPKDIAEAYRGLRGIALGFKPSDLGLTGLGPNQAYGVIMDWGIDVAIATVTGFASGDGSLYMSNGGGVIGGFAHEEVSDAAKQFVAIAQDRVRWMEPTTEFPLPRIGRVKFYVLTEAGVLTTDVRVEPIEPSYEPLWNAGQRLLAAIRISADKSAEGNLTPPAPNV